MCFACETVMNSGARDRMLWSQYVYQVPVLETYSFCLHKWIHVGCPSSWVKVTTVGGVCYKSEHTSPARLLWLPMWCLPPCNGEARRPRQRLSRCGHPTLGLPTLQNQEPNKHLSFINYLVLWLDLACAPKVHMVKAWLPACGTTERCGGAYWKEVTGACP